MRYKRGGEPSAGSPALRRGLCKLESKGVRLQPALCAGRRSIQVAALTVAVGLLIGRAWAQPEPAAPSLATPGWADEKPKGAKTKKKRVRRKARQPAGHEQDMAAEPATATEPPALAPPPAPPETPGAGTLVAPPPVDLVPAPADVRAAAESGGPPGRYGAGVRVRYITVPGWMMGPFTAESVPLHNMSIGGEFIRHGDAFDLAIGFDVSFMSPPDGNWLGDGRNPAVETDFVQFRGFKMWSLDALLLWNKQLSETLSLAYGAGLGIGFMQGQILRTSAGSPGCATAPGDPAQCYPVLPNCGPGPCSEEVLQRSMQQGVGDSAVVPQRYVDNSVPPVLPVLHLLAALIYDAGKHVRFRFEGGFRNALFLGAASEYRF